MKIGVIGGTGLYGLSGLTQLSEIQPDTPWGPASSPLMCGRLGDTDVVFVARHGIGHRFLPTEVPYRANVFALKAAGCSHVLSVSAVGSLQEAYAPGDVVVVDQFIDRTRSRVSTFFGKGVVAHVAFGEPLCGYLRGVVVDAAREVGAPVHNGGTYVCMEGPAFSTRAESRLYRSWGGDVIGMTNVTEAKLAREAGLSYATLAFVTDYDAWREGHDSVTAEEIMAVLGRNVSTARGILAAAIPRVSGPSRYASVLESSLMTDDSQLNESTRRWLDVLRGRG